MAELGAVRAGPDYLVRIDGHLYSIPHDKRGQEFDYHETSISIELRQLNGLIATHVRGTEKDGFTVLAAHRPAAHDAVQAGQRNAPCRGPEKWARGGSLPGGAP